MSERSHLMGKLPTEQIVFEPEYDPENYKKMITCGYCILLGMSCCMIAPCFCTPCVAGTIVENSGTYLTKDNIHIATAQNDFCWHVATDTQNVPLEQISDVEISRPCFTSCFGLSAIRVQHPGNISVGPKGRAVERGVMYFVKDPEEYRMRILEQKNRMKQQQYGGGGGGPGGMSMNEDFSTLRPFQQIEKLKQLLELGILSQTEYDEKASAIRNSPAFELQKKEMLGI
eukprot:CAMPEP_0201490668 /NCGR_PEP_ID=MMETSP0151_2-20130828/26947_1 /ASSEMBLY_ACC=CAM_ASM_000257 /TAXON_ID=200890 /ORGANISM="Paramoeba atlantica, Strain 621/1 / CCAP 1560/9" /LENGTH=228 /DNA_ID=CAMNT_0047876707 /DNA_START=46 /DNA_END=732 /DNA_ORIENTATION=-